LIAIASVYHIIVHLAKTNFQQWVEEHSNIETPQDEGLFASGSTQAVRCSATFFSVFLQEENVERQQE